MATKAQIVEWVMLNELNGQVKHVLARLLALDAVARTPGIRTKVQLAAQELVSCSELVNDALHLCAWQDATSTYTDGQTPQPTSGAPHEH